MTQATAGASEKTAVGSYFVSNYPPYSFWTPGQVGEAVAALDRPPMDKVPLGSVLSYPVLPEALPVLLLQGIY